MSDLPPKNQEDYSYFHVVPTLPNAFGAQPSSSASFALRTVFGISCVDLIDFIRLLRTQLKTVATARSPRRHSFPKKWMSLGQPSRRLSWFSPANPCSG